MIKYIFLFLTFFVGKNLVAQEKAIYLQTFVKSDTIQLRWSPNSVEGFIRGLEEGYLITRTEVSSGIKNVVEIKPFSERKIALLESNDSATVFTARFVEEFLSNQSMNNLQKQGPFFMFSLSASTNRSIAKTLGLYWEDVEFNLTKYTYSIQFLDSYKTEDALEVNANKKNKNMPCTELFGSSRVDLKEVYLSWDAKSLNMAYGGYWIMKSVDGEVFEKLNSIPLYYFTSQYEPDKTIIDFVDTAVTEGSTYYYQISPINHFADEGDASNIVEVYIQKRLNGICNIDTIRSVEFTRIIEGKYSSKIETDVINEYILYRGDKIDSTYIIVDQQKAKGNLFEFNYQADLLSGDRHYFKVAAVSQDKDTVLSFPYYHFSLDQEPPAAPTDFQGIITDEGVAKLKWLPPADKDVQGYRIYRANALNEEFVEITTFLSTNPTYTDTLRLDNLTSEVYYKINTVDLNYNNSKITEPILLLKPDTIAPVPSVIKKYRVEPNGIYLEWANSPSTDLKAQYLIRTDVNRTDTLIQFETDINWLLDSTCHIGQKYTYQIITTDKSDNHSQSESLTVTYETGFRNPPTNLNATVSRNDKMILLSWTMSGNEPIYSIQLYRAKNEGKFRLIKTLNEEVDVFEDQSLSPNNVYRYKIKVLYKSGKSTKMSDAIEVMY